MRRFSRGVLYAALAAGACSCADGPRPVTPEPPKPLARAGQPLEDAVRAARRDNPKCGTTVEALFEAASAARPPVSAVTNSEPATALGAGKEGMCAVLAGGWLDCWGVAGSLVGEPEEADFVRTPRRHRALEHVAEVALGQSHACARRASGEVLCFGWNELGQVGNGQAYPNDPGDFPHPELPQLFPVAGAEQARSIAVSAHHSCAALGSGAVVCWGSSESGEAGGERSIARLATPIAGVTRARRVACGEGFSCALDDAGAVACWGDYGQLGDAAHDAEHAPRQPAARAVALPPAAALAAGARLACALVRDGGALWCWGHGLEALGREGTAPARFALPKAASDVAVGAEPCVRFADGGVGCAGDMGRALAHAPEASDAATFALVPGLDGATALAVGETGACAVVAGGALRCWGGRNDLAEHALPVTALTLEGGAATALVSAGRQTCALDADGHAYCWGSHGSGRFEDTRPKQLPGLSALRALGFDEYGHRCVVLADGGVRCGARDGGEAPRLEPVPGLPLARRVSMGRQPACAVSESAEVWCWGFNGSGAVGVPPVEETLGATHVAGVSGATQVAAGDCSACAVGAPDGAVWCWGCNRDGLVGGGTTRDDEAPRRVVGVTHAQAVAVGSELACARDAEGRVACWGRGARAAVPFDGIEDAVDVAVGSNDACVARRSGSVECGIPGCHTTVPGIHDARRVSVGDHHACAALADGKIVCWGARNGAALGDVPDFDPEPRAVALP